MSPEKAPTVGQSLREERERRNISLADVARVTRIPLNNLEALEKDEFQSFPAPFFARGFLRTYAAHLGLDPGKVLALFEAQTAISLPAGGNLREPAPSFRLRSLVQYLLILVLVVCGVGIAYIYIQKEPTSLSPPSAEAPKPPALEEKTAPQPKKVLAPASAPVPAPVPAPGPPKVREEEKQVLRLKAVERVWIRFRLDSQPEFDVLLQPGETITRTADRQIKLTIGNAGGVEGVLNGKPLGRLGDSGQVVHLLLPVDPGKADSAEKKAP